jgi:hypothetical protein
MKGFDLDFRKDTLGKYNRQRRIVSSENAKKLIFSGLKIFLFQT